MNRGFTRMLEGLGIEVLAVRRGKHRVYRLRNAHGFETSVSVGLTPSDHRSGLNAQKRIERFARCRGFDEYQG